MRARLSLPTIAAAGMHGHLLPRTRLVNSAVAQTSPVFSQTRQRGSVHMENTASRIEQTL
jgi:hypothetical protein